MLKFVLANFRVVRLGTTLAQRKLFYKLRRERERLERGAVLLLGGRGERASDPCWIPPGSLAKQRGRPGATAFGRRGSAPAGTRDPCGGFR